MQSPLSKGTSESDPRALRRALIRFCISPGGTFSLRLAVSPRASGRKGHMKGAERQHLLERLDHHRLCLADAGPVAREFSADRSECRIP
jgi:hypothetical protein